MAGAQFSVGRAIHTHPNVKCMLDPALLPSEEAHHDVSVASSSPRDTCCLATVPSSVPPSPQSPGNESTRMSFRGAGGGYNYLPHESVNGRMTYPNF